MEKLLYRSTKSFSIILFSPYNYKPAKDPEIENLNDSVVSNILEKNRTAN